MPRFIVSLAVIVSLVALAAPNLAQAQSSSAYYKTGLALQNNGNFDRAIADYSQAIALNPNSVVAYNNRGYSWQEKGEQDKAIADFNQALALDPNYATAYNNRGYSWYMKKDFDRAVADYNQALALCPNDAVVFSNRGVVWDEKGEKDKAQADYNQALALDPNVATAYSNRGTVESSHGEFDKANADFNRALSIDPNLPAAYENLGFFQATCPDPRYRNGQKAFENASRGYMLDTEINRLYTDNALAAAYAECGDFAQAQVWQEKVVALSPPEVKQLEAARLELFKQGKPYRSTPKPAAE